MNDRQKYAKVKRNISKIKFLFSQLIVKFSLFSKFTDFFWTFTKKVLRVKRADVRKLVFAICLLNVAVPMRDESRKGEANTKRSGENCSQKQLRSVD